MVPGLSEEHESLIAGQWQDIVDEIAEGKLARDALAERGLSKTSVRRFRLADPARVQAWDAAIKESTDALREEHLETARNDVMDPSRVRARCNALEWQMAKRDPDRYSDRSRMDVTHKVIDYAAILARAEARLAERAQPALDIVDAELVEPIALGKALTHEPK